MDLQVRSLFALTILLLASIMSVTAQDGATTRDLILEEIITIEGEVQEILSHYAFVMDRTEPFDFGDVEVVVINDDTQPFLTDVNVGKTVQVTGAIRVLTFDTILNTVDYEVEAALFEAFETDDYVMTANAVIDPIDLPVAGEFDYDPIVTAEVELNPTTYLGETFTVEGYVAEILGENSFRLENVQPFNVTPGSFVIVNDDNEPFEIPIYLGRHIRVTGPIYGFEPETFSSDIDFDFDEETFADYSNGDYWMLSESIMTVAARTTDTVYATESDPAPVTMDDLEDDPFAYIGEIVTVQGEVEITYTETDFLLEEDEFFDLDPMQIPVFSSVEIRTDDDLFDFIDDELYLVTGEVVPFNLLEIEERTGFTPDPTLYSDFTEDNIAIIATIVTRLNE